MNSRQLSEVPIVSEADTDLLSFQLSPKAVPSGLQVLSQPLMSLSCPRASITFVSMNTNVSLN